MQPPERTNRAQVGLKLLAVLLPQSPGFKNDRPALSDPVSNNGEPLNPHTGACEEVLDSLFR